MLRWITLRKLDNYRKNRGKYMATEKKMTWIKELRTGLDQNFIAQFFFSSYPIHRGGATHMARNGACHTSISQHLPPLNRSLPLALTVDRFAAQNWCFECSEKASEYLTLLSEWYLGSWALLACGL
jgi:hypothetical protein